MDCSHGNILAVYGGGQRNGLEHEGLYGLVFSQSQGGGLCS
uniref:Uncharacterized protein n=1 Tax=Anguilla anguilla TaxID=7936 RepID=A0A0E9RVW7_ANGAN